MEPVETLGKYFLLFCRVYLGAFNLASGINYFTLVWPQPIPADPVGAAYMNVTLHLGMFQLAKVVELVSGVCLVSNIFVPLALVLLFPITVNIFIMNTFFSPLAHVAVSGARNFAFHTFLFIGYGSHFVPLLQPRAEVRPIWRAFTTNTSR